MLDPLGILSSVRSAGSPATSPHKLQLAGSNFSSLLSQAQNLSLSSASPVTVDARSKIELSADQLERLSVAADRAEALGMDTALVLIDGKGVVLDVGARRVTSQIDQNAVALSDVDGVIAAPPRSLAQAIANSDLDLAQQDADAHAMLNHLNKPGLDSSVRNK
jgi:hypothetical protein